MRRRPLIALSFLLFLSFVGCSGEEQVATRPLLPARAQPPRPEVVYAPEAAGGDQSELASILPAFASDMTYASGGAVDIRRLIYRVTLRVPRNLGYGHSTVQPPIAELRLDVSRTRLRARFVGGGWPVPEGSEVRLRQDEPGVYIFDGRGGRPLGPGQLARWFEGGRLRRAASLRVALSDGPEDADIGRLVCRFIAEWSHTSPDALDRRCAEGGTPPSFRVGLWRATRTADVQMSVPKRTMRADHESPPEGIPDEHGRPFIDDMLLARLRPLRGHHPAPEDDAPPRGLTIVNTGRARMMVTIGGTPLGWLDAGTELNFPALRPGSYAIGAMRPLGLQTAQRRARVVPGRVSLPRRLRR